MTVSPGVHRGVVGTFILVFTIFGVIHCKAAAGFAGVAIGLVVFARTSLSPRRPAHPSTPPAPGSS